MNKKLSDKIADEVGLLLNIQGLTMDAHRFQKYRDAGKNTVMEIIKEEMINGLGSEILNLLDERGYDLSKLDRDDISTIINRRMK